MSQSQMAPPPGNDSVIEMDQTRPDRRDPFYMAKAWLLWFYQTLVPRVQQGTQVILDPAATGATLLNKNAAIATTPLPIGDLPAGTYRVSYNARKTAIDGVNSSLSVILGWTDGEDSSSQILTGPAMALDTTTSPQSGSIVVTIAAASPLTYATLYTSNTPGNMKYKLEFTVEAL